MRHPYRTRRDAVDANASWAERYARAGRRRHAVRAVSGYVAVVVASMFAATGAYAATRAIPAPDARRGEAPPMRRFNLDAYHCLGPCDPCDWGRSKDAACEDTE